MRVRARGVMRSASEDSEFHDSWALRSEIESAKTRIAVYYRHGRKRARLEAGTDGYDRQKRAGAPQANATW